MQPSTPPDSAPLEVDRVEWVPASAEFVHVHLRGRWIDRPVAEPLVLLVGTERRRYSFDALDPAPEGVIVAFAVPNELRSRLSEDISLQIGAYELVLPAAGPGPVSPLEEDEPAEVIDRAVLAERRARRAEMAEEGLERRAGDAERTAETLEAQLANLEERLEQARDDTNVLGSQMAEAERKLRAAEQREYAEQQLRIEAQDELERMRRGGEAEVEDLRRRIDAANQRAEGLAREVDRARRAIAEAHQSTEAHNAALRRMEETEAALVAERASREQAESALEGVREEAQAKITLLEHELDERHRLHSRIGDQLMVMRGELERLRAESDAQSQDEALKSLEALQEMAEKLQERIGELERRKDAAEAELAQANVTIDELRAAAGDLQRTLDAERRDRAEAEAVLRGEIAAAVAGGPAPDDAELRAALERERQAFAEQVVEIERLVGRVREQTVGAVAQLRDALEAERAGRAEAERLLAVERTRMVRQRNPAAAALGRLAVEQERRTEVEAQIAQALAAVREAREHDDTRSVREAEVQRLVGEVLGTAASLREAYERESRKLEGELTARVVEERREMAAQLEAMEARATDLTVQVQGVGDQLEAELIAERAARQHAEAELARERSGEVEVVEAPAEDVTPPPIVADLDTAAERLREQIPEPETPAPPERAGTFAVRPRLVAPADRERAQWLIEAIVRLSATDAETAERLLLGLLPIQGPAYRGKLVYDLTLPATGTHRVSLYEGVAHITALPGPGAPKEVDFQIAGTAATLASLGAGAAAKRPKETQFDGSSRKLRRLLRHLREPVQLRDLASAGIAVDPGVVLEALAVTTDPMFTAGQDFSVAFKITGSVPGAWTVVVGEGFPKVQRGVPDGGASATVYTPQAALLPLLGGTAPPPGVGATASGDERAVELLRQWFELAQGL